MNYLAHIFLSGTNRKIQIGNFIGDAVKGNSYKNYPQDISNGILLHRAIDNYTDHHLLVIETVRKLKPDFGRYSGVLLDIWFDYLLASHFTIFSKVPLKHYVRRFYFSLIMNYRHLPPRIKGFIWHFILTDRLGSYSGLQGIRDSLEIMVKYHRIDISVEKAMQYLSEYKDELFAVFLQFFQELQLYCNNHIPIKSTS